MRISPAFLSQQPVTNTSSIPSSRLFKVPVSQSSRSGSLYVDNGLVKDLDTFMDAIREQAPLAGLSDKIIRSIQNSAEICIKQPLKDLKLRSTGFLTSEGLPLRTLTGVSRVMPNTPEIKLLETFLNSDNGHTHVPVDEEAFLKFIQHFDGL